MRFKKTLTLILTAAVSATLLMGCGGSSNSGDGAAEKSSQGEKGSVYYLNFKPEVDEVWQKIAKDYTEDTGVEMKVVTAASNNYETTLKAEISKKDAPTLFQINGPVGYESWKDYTLDLKDSEIYKHLLDKSMAVSSGDGVYGIPYVVEGYGIIYNDAIMQKYFSMPDAKAKSIDDIKDFAKLKEVSDDMQSKKDKLEIDGVFACTSLQPGEDWRWQTHLANLPIFYEYRDNHVDNMDKITFKYAPEYKNIFDLYITDSTVPANVLTSKSVTDSMAEFALGKCAMVQNGNWAWSQISGVDGNKVKAEDIKFLPIYTGVKGEEKQSLCIGTENFFSVNSQTSEANQKASLEFLNWLFTTEKGKNYVTKELGFITPFDTFSEKEVPEDPLAKEIRRFMSNKDLYNVNWCFTTFPSQSFKDSFGQALGQYAAGEMSWDEVAKLFVNSWNEEKEAAK